jgi:hypothetical protein
MNIQISSNRKRLNNRFVFFIFLNLHRPWEGSWEDGAQTWAAPEGAYNPEKIYEVNLSGKHYKMCVHFDHSLFLLNALLI